MVRFAENKEPYPGNYHIQHEMTDESVDDPDARAATAVPYRIEQFGVGGIYIEFPGLNVDGLPLTIKIDYWKDRIQIMATDDAQVRRNEDDSLHLVYVLTPSVSSLKEFIGQSQDSQP